ncbi:PAS domain-containing sensor histidine kinase [Limnohabitans sp. JirII-29]|uniref:two-component system sensor histidine kinase NtrB n=1 Tax=unclassified Limnohabitans TaxID=2626134 RepID=UPI000C1DF558|nr:MULTISPECIES: ATP-binding protein [unclassified Limnohabitans]PIT75126.1 PAS domain-containing sensor histidine kinase [Limnohabitans sp. JirII-31]PUE27719.1 PAS domain-containing sensor histidine kinase [Limnohabitans sp. JirII-29]
MPFPAGTLLRRWALWLLLVLLVLSMLSTLVWLAGRYEVSQVQSRIERDASDAVSDIRAALTRNVQTLQTLQFVDHTQRPWPQEAANLLREHREWLRLEWRDPDLRVIAAADTPFRAPVFAKFGRSSRQPEVVQACAVARRQSGPGYGVSNYVPQNDGLGLEIMDLCLPVLSDGQLTGYTVASYALNEILAGMVGPQLTRSQEVSFTESDGTRLAKFGTPRRGSRVFTAQQLLDLPGHAMVLRLDSWRAAPDLFPNVLTALVTAMAIALVTVLIMLARDMRRRQRVESDLADALAFRKAMEDSLVTGLRARDNQGRITYVNPAFCEMVGFSAKELLGHGIPAPYWPPEMIDEYGQRQALRLAGNAPPREGVESVFMHKNGQRIAVLIFEAPLINAQGQQTGWMSAVLDISEQRRVEELSRASQERLQATARLATVGEMASLLSHELNQPLAAISSYATGSMNLLQDVALQDPTLADMLGSAIQRIGQQAERAGRVIKSVHDFVRRRDQAREAVLPLTLLDNVMPLIILQARKLGVRVVVRCPQTLPAVLCDRTMVEQVLLNLARNAMQAMAEDTSDKVLTLTVRPAASNAVSRWMEFLVTDVGPGIAPAVAEKLFTPFFTTKAEGMGLGLSLCRTVVEQHGGLLSHCDHTPRGTVFSFTLPQA